MSVSQFRGTVQVKDVDGVEGDFVRLSSVVAGQGTSAALTFTSASADTEHVKSTTLNTITVYAPPSGCDVHIDIGLNGQAAAGTTDFELQENAVGIHSSHTAAAVSMNLSMHSTRYLAGGTTAVYKIVSTVGGAGTFVQDGSVSFFSVYLSK